MKFTQIAPDAFKKIQLNAGVLLTEFDPTTGTIDRESIFGATTGGVTFNAAPEYIDFGEDIDNVPNNTKELKRLDAVTATLGGTFLTVDTEACRKLIGAADVDAATGKVTPRADLLQSDFTDVWWVGDYSDVNTGDEAGFVAIHLINALSTGGFQMQSSDRGKGNYSFEFTAHYSITDVSAVPYEVYIKGSTGPKLSVLTFGTLSLTPAFDPDVTEYTLEVSAQTTVITATAEDGEATVSIMVNGSSHTSGTSASWKSGSNTVAITVTLNGSTTTYNIAVTKSS